MKLSICFTVDSVEFDAGVIAGTTSLGGSESACVGLARALKARGHDVHIFTTKLAPDAPQTDHAGVGWHDMSKLAAWALFTEWDIAVALRQPMFLSHLPAKFRVLWAQDLMAHESMKQYVMSLAWAYDAVAYVSRYHQAQWEALVPELEGIGWATKNGHDAALAKAARDAATKKPHQIIHISRPERGLMPILAMWPELRRQYPSATLALCRYSSMYDPQGWGEVCRSFDDAVAQVNAEVGGITYLGELGKPALYQAIAESAVMWYPGVSDFAETSCIAAIEAQACGTPFVGSYKGALPETVPGGVLVKGVAEADPDYHKSSIAAVIAALKGCAAQTFDYRRTIKAGLAHVEDYTYDVIAAEWEAWMLRSCQARYEAHKPQILARLDYEDDLVTGRVVADELIAEGRAVAQAEALKATAALVETGRSHTADAYGEFALETTAEVNGNGARHHAIVQAFDGCRQVLDVACGNGAIAIMLAQADRQRKVTAIDFSEANIAQGRAAAESFGVAHQITFVCAPAWDMETQTPAPWLQEQVAASYDGVVCGEFLEHVTNAEGLIDALERVARPLARFVWTVPMGALRHIQNRADATYRSHVHHFRPSDLEALFGQKQAYVRQVLPWGMVTGRGEPVGQWIVTYRKDGPTGRRPLERRILTRPYRRITAGLILNDTTDVRRCLESIWPIVDEIVLGDTGCRPNEIASVLAEFPRKTRVVPVGAVHSLEGGFSEARNAVLAASTGDWFFWIDADEVLVGQVALGKYLDGPVFNGYIIPQNHLYLDGPMGTDEPVRVFRTDKGIQFYGCIHEQPQMGDANTDIAPLLKLSDVQIAHTGYLHENLRREKAIKRNLPLLVRDQQVFPERLLGKLLVLREHANLALWELERTQGRMTATVKEHYAQVVGLFERYFTDPAHKYYPLARPFYEQALQHVAGAVKLESAIQLSRNGNTAEPVTVRVWARTPEQARQALERQIDAVLAPLKPAPPMDCEPLPVAVDDVVGVPV